MEVLLVIIGLVFVIIIAKGIKIVPQQEVWVIEKLGKFDRVIEAGLKLLIPFVEYVAYKHTLKEEAVNVTAQTAISQDNVSLNIDGVLYVKIIDPKAASYGVSDPYYAISQLAQTTMRSEIGKMPLDKTFEERESLNINIVQAINEAAQNWGIQCMRYEIKDIHPPESVLNAMELQVAADRKKRANILESEGQKQSKINIAEADKQEVVLNSEAAKTDQINRASGEGQAIETIANSTAISIDKIAEASRQDGGNDAVSMRIAEQYVEAFGNLAKEGNTVIVPANVNDASSLVAQSLTIFKQLAGGEGNPGELLNNMGVSSASKSGSSSGNKNLQKSVSHNYSAYAEDSGGKKSGSGKGSNKGGNKSGNSKSNKYNNNSNNQSPWNE
jgi:regulator of protease activity HflC (stomatin/prohibitin superfamily)